MQSGSFPGGQWSDKAQRDYWQKAENDLKDPEGVRQKYVGRMSLFWKIALVVIVLAIAVALIFF